MKCPQCDNAFKVPGAASVELPAGPRAIAEDDWLSLDAPAIADVDRRKQEAAAVQAQRQAARGHHHTPATVRPAGAQPGQNIRPPAAQAVPRANQPAAGKPAEPGRVQPDHQEGDFQLAPLHATTPKQPSSAETRPSIFDDDLPELADLAAPSGTAKHKPLLQVDLEDLEGAVAPLAKGFRSGQQPRRVSSAPPPPPNRAGGSAKPQASQPEEPPKDYRVTCSVCGTAQYLPLSAKGMKVKCPDCHSSFVAPAPATKRAKPKIELSGDELPLAPTHDQWQQAELDAQRLRTNKMLERAQRELTEDEVDSLYDGDFDTAGFVRRSLGLLFDPVAVAFMVGYGIVFALLFALAQFGVLNSDSGIGGGTLLLATTVAPLIGVMFGMPMLSSALALLESVANRQPRVQEWPGFNVFDNFGDLLAILAAILFSALPGGVLGYLIAGEGYGVDRVRFIVALISLYFLFPIILLSILDNGSLARPLSEAVLRSIKSAAEAWGAYYLKTLLLFGTAIAAWLVLLGPDKPPAVVAIAGFLVSPLVYFTFQQLGALADAISEHLSFEFAPSNQDAAEEDGGQA